MLIHMTLTYHQPSKMSCNVWHSEAATQRRNPGLERRHLLQGKDIISTALQNTNVLEMVSVSRVKNFIFNLIMLEHIGPPMGHFSLCVNQIIFTVCLFVCLFVCL